NRPSTSHAVSAPFDCRSAGAAGAEETVPKLSATDALTAE
ncbi:hypothetical protein ABHI18_011332, partial [Aspergillus niger]